MPVAKLDNAPRCQHTKLNGFPCAAPARRNRKYCVFHEAAHAARPDYASRLVEDAMSLQLAIFQVMRALDDGALDAKRASLKLYALQIAASNLKRLHEETREATDASAWRAKRVSRRCCSNNFKFRSARKRSWPNKMPHKTSGTSERHLQPDLQVPGPRTCHP